MERLTDRRTKAVKQMNNEASAFEKAGRSR